MRSEEFLNGIRGAEGLKRAILKKIVVEKREIVFHLVTDLSYTKEDVAHANEIASHFAPAGYSASVRVVKSVPSEEGVRRAVADALKSRYPAAAAFVSPGDIEVILDGAGGRFTVAVSAGEEKLFEDGGVLDTLSGELKRQFCGTWYGDFRSIQKEKGEIEREEDDPAEIVYGPRFFPVTEYVSIDGAAPKNAIYIADLDKEITGVSVCGRLSYLEERESKNGRPYFSFTLSDGTGSLRVAYFTKKATIEKVRGLAIGDSVCITGDNELYNGGLSFRAKQIDYGAPPQDFTPETHPSKPVPKRYRRVFPEPASDFVQAGLFDARTLPESFMKKEFVVFDLETTGLGEGGVMDRIIEVGAVKIKEGRIMERFSTFVACPVKLSEKIVELTGITDEMLVGAPPVGEVIADFYKFCDGAVLVGHNVQFDCKFVRYYGEKEGYLFDHRQYDTVSFAQEMLRLSNYKLNTVADHFGFSFNHHKAFDDAFVTAKIFIELVKLKGGLPV